MQLHRVCLRQRNGALGLLSDSALAETGLDPN